MGRDTFSDSIFVKTIEDEKEAEHVDTSDYFFDKIGEAVPLKPSGSLFDLNNPPSVPLVVAESCRLIFAAHSTGFYVAKIGDVIKSAKEWKKGGGSCSVQELSIVDVLVGRVHILALSVDSSITAASVGGNVYFFWVKSLLAKEQNPFFSCSVGSDNIKDFWWSKMTTFLILSKSGILYRGTLEEPLEPVMDNVDAVHFGLDGEFLAVAIKNVLKIFSLEFTERLNILLELKLEITDFSAFRVDCIRWVRSDCIMLGCFEQMPDSTEENYLVRAILSKNGKEIIDASSTLVALCFSDLFPCTVDDIVPSGSGPHLMMSYLETRQLAVVANRKNVDQHIMLIGWKQEGDEPAVINIERDNWLPRIELQENGDDNLLLGICVDRFFACNNIEVKVGDEEVKELSPDCLIFCLTHEGKLILFHFASVSGDSDLPPNAGMTSDKEENTSSFQSSDLVKLSSHKEDVKVGHLNSDTYSCELYEDKIGSNEGDQILIQNHQKKIDVDHTLTKEIISGEEEHRILKAGNHLESNSAINANKELGCQQLGHSVSSSLPMRFTADSTHKNAYSISDAEHLNLVGLTSGSDHSSKKQLSGSSYFPNYGKLHNELSGNIGSTILQNVSDQPDSIKVFSSSSMSVSSKSVTPLSTAFTEGHKSDRKFSLDPPKHILSSFVHSNAVTRGPVSSALGSSTLASVSSSHSIEVPFQSRRVSGKALDHSILSSPSDHLNFEPSTSKKYGNMRDMATELDRLLDSIEAGSFRDNCASFENSILETLKALFDRCTVSKNIADKQVEEIQDLLQNTVHALTRKTYMEAIVKQTSNRQYWDIWDCQKLSSELELKRQNMMIISQNLINQLIELEKHFNALEMKSYGENSGIVIGCRHRKKESTSSRQIQSLHTVHNAISSQLAAAEQLSDCLSMQMAELSIASPSVDVGFRSQLFEMIGIPYEGVVQGSSHIRKVTDPPINATVSVSPVSTVMKSECRSNQSGINNHEPETARRRRESLDLNWASFAPSRTTVKRMLDGHENLDVQRTDKRNLCSPNSRISIVPQVEHISQRLKDGVGDVATESVSSSLITRAKDLSETFRSAAEQTPEKQILEEGHLTAFSSHSFSKSTPHMDLGVTRDMPQSIGKQLDPNKSHIKSFESVILKESYIGQQSELQRNPTLPIFESCPSCAFSLSKESGEKISYESSEGSASGKPGSGIIKSFSVGFPDSSFSSQPTTLGYLTIPPCIQSSEVSTSFSSSVVPHSLSFPVVSSTSLSKASTSLSTSAVRRTMISSVDSVSSSDDTVKKDSISTSLTSSAATFVNFPNSHLTKSYEMNGSPSCISSSTLSSSVKSASKSVEHQSQADEVDNRSLLFSHTASESNEPVFSSFMESSVDFMKSSGQWPPSSLSTAGVEEKPSESVYSKGQFGSNILSSELIMDKVILSEFSFCSGTSSNPSLNTLPDKSGVHTGTNNSNNNMSAGSDLAAGQTHEDEMEEEGVSDSVNLSLESLGGLGVLGAGSGPNPPTSIIGFGPNPFGGPVVGSSSSPRILTIPSGEIFRPASLSFQPLQSQPVNAVPLPGSASVAPGTGSGFGQPAQVGSGSGTHTLGSVLGSFGQSRQLGGSAGGSLPNTFGAQFPPKSKNDTAASGGFSGGFAQVSAPGGGSGGFGGVGGGSGGFAGISASSGGFPAAASGGTGFGAFGNPRGSGFSAFAGGSVGSTRPPSELFTQMRK